MSKRTCLAIVLAAGEGTRMRSLRPKVLHALGGKPLLAHALAAVAKADAVAVVIGPAPLRLNEDLRLRQDAFCLLGDGICLRTDHDGGSFRTGSAHG